MAGLWDCSSCPNDADVKNSEPTKNVTASATVPTALTYQGTVPMAKQAAPTMNRPATAAFRTQGASRIVRGSAAARSA